MICIHPTVAASPRALAALQLETGLRAMPGRIYGRLVAPCCKKKSESHHVSNTSFSKMVSRAICEITNDWDGGNAA